MWPPALQEVRIMKKHFPAGADKTVWIVTTSSIALLFLLLALAGGITSMPISAAIVLYIVAGIIALVLLIGWLAKPIRYEVRDDSVSIVRMWPFSTIRIPKSEITEIRHLRLVSVAPTSVAVIWIFGYVGRFRSNELDSFVMLATNLSEPVLINADERYIVSPANPKRFMHDLSGKK